MKCKYENYLHSINNNCFLIMISEIKNEKDINSRCRELYRYKSRALLDGL